jgi:hypothetical protein
MQFTNASPYSVPEESVVDLMAREGTTFPIFSAYIVTSS